ncbi:MAG: hypothetical protein ACREQ5_27735, partial [Candidatus Dormibacteria bacterium]
MGTRDDAAALVLGGLKRLEYRGYDSWGIASAAGHAIRVVRGVGRISGVDPAALSDGQIDPSRVA